MDTQCRKMQAPKCLSPKRLVAQTFVSQYPNGLSPKCPYTLQVGTQDRPVWRQAWESAVSSLCGVRAEPEGFFYIVLTPMTYIRALKMFLLLISDQCLLHSLWRNCLSRAGR